MILGADVKFTVCIVLFCVISVSLSLAKTKEKTHQKNIETSRNHMKENTNFILAL